MAYVKDSRSLAQGCRCYEQIRVVNVMNDLELCVKGSRCYEMFRVMDNMNDLKS